MSERLDTAIGRELVDDLGFLLVGGRPFAPAPAYLFVALRRQPSLRHFDPERIDLWHTVDAHGHPLSIEWSTREAAVSDYSWGMIEVIDRVNARNEFATFGGSLLVARVADVKVAVLSSEAPIVACGGHSQDWSFGAREMAGFVARLRAAADPRGTLEADLARLTPVARYAAFVADSLARIRAREAKFGWARGDRAILEAERRRMRSASDSEWSAGLTLAERLRAG